MEQAGSDRHCKPRRDSKAIICGIACCFIVIFILLVISIWYPASTSPALTVRVDFSSLENSREEIPALEEKMKSAGVSTVALGAGRLDWNYFKWKNHENYWSQDVQDTGIDFLAEDSKRFSKWANVDIVVDLYAPNYIREHPKSSAISWLGEPSSNLVSTMELVEGDFGEQILQMLEYISTNYPANSISLTELAYYTDGYGDDDKAAYMSYTGRDDWPRLPNGLINIDDPSIGEWRSYEVGRFLDRAAKIVHKNDKKLYMDVEVSWDDLSKESTEKGQSYHVMLEHVDKIVIWDYFGLKGYDPEVTREIAHEYGQKYDPSRIIISIGLWKSGNDILSSEELKQAMHSSIRGGIGNLWITPSHYLSDDHWEALSEINMSYSG
ncbi:hypothetical protein [Methanosarcina acetivorans]|uniref:GH18 domain-containing protein n=1 Tax=Methanosarcina acetivorans (strain ATCC 35395 / DSM 2834 / JCM 12185 / C2A) TaxID=188937 RepID=Q8TN32_METAC|nr:hypothetical protein [Methanosarcina acetivorans]AAM05847.1 predicted protein [Methanosarcina acetivorans C2A]